MALPRYRSARRRAPRTYPATGSARLRADVYHAIADPTRRCLLDLLGTGERHVNALAAPFRMTRPAVSQHLRILRQAGLVDARRAGRERRYRLRAVRLRQVYDWVAHYERFWKQKLTALGKYLNREREENTEVSDGGKKRGS